MGPPVVYRVMLIRWHLGTKGPRAYSRNVCFALGAVDPAVSSAASDFHSAAPNTTNPTAKSLMRCSVRRRRIDFWRDQRIRVHRPDPGDDFPEIIVSLDDFTEGRHRSSYGLVLDALIALLLQVIGAKSDQAEQRV